MDAKQAAGPVVKAWAWHADTARYLAFSARLSLAIDSPPQVQFKITNHAGSGAPEDAIELLLPRLGERRGEVSFAQASYGIRATVREGAPTSMERRVREEVGRRMVLDIVRAVCESEPDLEFKWYAVSVAR